jgi:hypothetical protein
VIGGAGIIQLATVCPPQAEDDRQHCSDKSDDSDDNQDIGHDYKLALYLAVTWKRSAARR